MHISQRTVATKVGVHVSTVSRALSGHPSVDEALRQRIKAVADELGYRPNPLVSALMATRRRRDLAPGAAGTIAIIDLLPTLPLARRATPIENTPWGSGAMKRATALGFAVDIFRLSDTPAERINRILLARGIGGLIFSRPSPTQQAVNLPLQWQCFAVGCVSFVSRDPPMHCVLSHDLRSIRYAIEHARRLGYQRAGLAMLLRASAALDHARVAGYALERELHGPPACLPVLLSRNGECAEFLAWFERYRPQVIISAQSDWFAALQGQGVRIPDDVGWIHLSQALPRPDVAHIRHRDEIVAQAAVDLVVGQLHRNERGLPAAPTTVLVEDEFVPGASLPAAPVYSQSF